MTPRDHSPEAIVPVDHEQERRRLLDKTWGDPPGIIGWFKSVNDREIGRRYILTAFSFFVAAGILAGLMRMQLMRPENSFLGPDKYNQIFTMHGTTMMFLFAVPMMFEALGVYVVPLMVGARNICFPRLNAYSYYLYLFGGLMLWIGFFLNIGPDAGWFSYVPLAGPDFSPGKRVDFWAQMITFTEVSGLLVAVEIVVTVMKLRAPGMSLNRIPLFVWALFITAIMVIFAMPSIMVSSTGLILDRLVGTHLFNPAEGGDVLLYQHWFWFFGHPEVYIIFMPALGIVSTIISTFTRRRIFGYLALLLSMVATGFIGFGVWVHHMFATGLPMLANNYFTAASLMISIPTAMQIFCWIATIWGGKLWLRTPMLWVLGFFFVFIIGGMTGVMLASVPFDTQVHDTYFVVAHFHYVLIGGAVFPLFGGLYYWFPKITGRMFKETAGRWHFWLFFFGFNLTFFPMHILGLHGMPRRIYTYQGEMGWNQTSLMISCGAVLMIAGVAVFMWNALTSMRSGEPAGDNPWKAATLEWATTSPPPPCNFYDLPTVSGRDAIWDATPDQPVVVGLDETTRQVLITKVMDADPDHLDEFPEPSSWPFWAAVSTTVMFIWSIFSPWGVVWGSIPVAITVTGWFWPNQREVDIHRKHEKWDTSPV